MDSRSCTIYAMLLQMSVVSKSAKEETEGNMSVTRLKSHTTEIFVNVNSV